LTYPNLTEFLEEIQNAVMPFFDWSEESSEEDIDECPSPPEPPLAPPSMPPIPEILTEFQEFYLPPFQPFERYLRDTRPRQHRTTLQSIRCLQDIITHDMTSASWSDRIQSVREFRRSENKDYFTRVHQQRVHVNYKRNRIFNIPAILYTNQEHSMTPELRHLLWSESPYLVAHPDSNIAQLLIIAINGLNQEGNVVPNIRDTLYFVYSALHILVERELAQEQDRLGQEWHQRIHDSWDISRRKYFYPDDYGWIQYQEGPTVKGMIEQHDRESLEIFRKSDVLWAEKEMLWISSLGEDQRKVLGFSEDLESEIVESSGPPISSLIVVRNLDCVVPNNSCSVTGVEGQSSNS
jgi:hypothetical protein